MRLFRSLFILAALATPGFVGCGGSSGEPQSPDKTELEQFMADNPELANEEMPELDE